MLLCNIHLFVYCSQSKSVATKSTLKKRNPADQLGVVVVAAAAVAARTVHAVVLAVGPVETPAGVQVVVVDKLAVEEVEGLVRITEEDLGRVVALQVQGLDLADAQVVVETVVDVVENISDFVTRCPTLV